MVNPPEEALSAKRELYTTQCTKYVFHAVSGIGFLWDRVRVGLELFFCVSILPYL